MISQEHLKKLFKYEENTGIFKRLTAISNSKIGQIAGTLRLDGYIALTINKKRYKAHKLAWLYVYGKYPDEIDHINLNKSDNRIVNLREVTHQQNMQNRLKPKSNKSGFKGVHFDKNKNRWVAQCGHKKIKYHIGYFSNAIDASIAYQNFAKKLHGDFYIND